jgi:hypothetical protein
VFQDILNRKKPNLGISALVAKRLFEGSSDPRNDCFGLCALESDTLGVVVESDLAFLPVLLYRFTRKQFHIEFMRYTKATKELLWNREQ